MGRICSDTNVVIHAPDYDQDVINHSISITDDWKKDGRSSGKINVNLKAIEQVKRRLE